MEGLLAAAVSTRKFAFHGGMRVLPFGKLECSKTSSLLVVDMKNL